MKYLARKLFFTTDFRGRMRLIRFFLSPLRTTKSTYGPQMTVDAKDYTNLASLFGAYGSELKDLILELPADGVFLDIGANAGVYSLIASAHLKSGRVISFEPNPHVFGKFLRNLELNTANNVLALNGAVGAPGGLLELTLIRSHTGAGYLTSAATSELFNRPVVCFNLSEFPFINEMLVGKAVLCKIDVEGAESLVLDALVNSGILSKIDQVYVEICEPHLKRFETTPEALYTKFKEQGFRPTKEKQGRTRNKSYDELFCRDS